MSLLIEFLSILLIYGAGMLLGNILPIPSSLISMVLFFLLLLTGLLNDRHFTGISRIILANLAFFFLPPAVQILDSMDVLSGSLIKLVAVIVLSNVCVMSVTGLVVQSFLKKGAAHES